GGGGGSRPGPYGSIHAVLALLCPSPRVWPNSFATISARRLLEMPVDGDTPSWIVRLPSLMVNDVCAPAGWLASAVNGAFHCAVPLTPLKPPVPTTPEPVNVPLISLFGSLKSTSLTPFGAVRPPREPVRTPE